MDNSVYNACNACNCTGYELLIHKITFDDAKVLEVYKDHVGRHRAVIFKTAAHAKGYSGVVLDPHGMIMWKETAPAMRHLKSTRQLCMMLSSLGIAWYPSHWQTEAGAACYARRTGCSDER